MADGTGRSAAVRCTLTPNPMTTAGPRGESIRSARIPATLPSPISTSLGHFSDAGTPGYRNRPSATPNPASSGSHPQRAGATSSGCSSTDTATRCLEAQTRFSLAASAGGLEIRDQHAADGAPQRACATRSTFVEPASSTTRTRPGASSRSSALRSLASSIGSAMGTHPLYSGQSPTYGPPHRRDGDSHRERSERHLAVCRAKQTARAEPTPARAASRMCTRRQASWLI